MHNCEFGRVAQTRFRVKQVIVMRTDLGMNAGKMCAQAAHASMLFLLEVIRGRPMTPEEREWSFGSSDTSDSNFGGMKKVVVAINGTDALSAVMQQASEAGLIAHIVTDRTLGLPTCGAIGPDQETKINCITGSLPMLKSLRKNQ